MSARRRRDLDWRTCAPTRKARRRSLLRPRVLSVCRLACSVLSVSSLRLPDTLGEHPKIAVVADPELV